MALFIRQDENQSEMQKRLATELQERAKKRAEAADRPDGVEDSAYIGGTKQTTSLAWIWILIIFAVIVTVIWLMIQSIVTK